LSKDLITPFYFGESNKSICYILNHLVVRTPLNSTNLIMNKFRVVPIDMSEALVREYSYELDDNDNVTKETSIIYSGIGEHVSTVTKEYIYIEQ